VAPKTSAAGGKDANKLDEVLSKAKALLSLSGGLKPPPLIGLRYRKSVGVSSSPESEQRRKKNRFRPGLGPHQFPASGKGQQCQQETGARLATIWNSPIGVAYARGKVQIHSTGPTEILEELDRKGMQPGGEDNGSHGNRRCVGATIIHDQTCIDIQQAAIV
jgi:hypothetical protein